VFDSLSVSGLEGLTGVFWAKNAKNKTTEGNGSTAFGFRAAFGSG
jgi:hypothetical protein